MIQNILGILVGAVVTLVALLVLKATNVEGYVPALIIGGIATFLWPTVIGFWLGRRRKSRRDDAIESEVQRQIAEQSKDR